MNSHATLCVTSREEWRAWLLGNHDRSPGIWFVFYKRRTGKKTVTYDDAVEEALCFGWIDSTVRRLDDERYCQRFTPRKERSTWSALNRKRVARLIKDGLMTEHGLRLVKVAKRTARWNPPELAVEMVPEFEKALAGNKKAQEAFEALAPSYRKQYVGWIGVAKRPETKAKRVKESVALLAQGKKLGMK